MFVVITRTGWIDRPRTEAPKTQIHFTTHRSGAFLVLRQRTVVRGERASRSIVNRTTALWSIWMVSSLILAGLVYFVVFVQTRGTEVAESRGSYGSPHVADSPTTARTNGDGFCPAAGPAAQTRRRRAQKTWDREFYEVPTRQERRRPVTPVAAARRRWLPLRRGATSHASPR